MLKTGLVGLCLFFTEISIGQSGIFVRGVTEDPGSKFVSVNPPLRDCIKGWIQIDNIPIDSTHHFAKFVKISSPSIAYFKCTDYVEAYVQPGDTIDLIIKKLPASKYKFDGVIKMPIDYEAIITGNHDYTNFFTRLERETGSMNNVPYSNGEDLSVEEKNKRERELYDKRMLILNEFTANHTALPSQFINSAGNEIRGKYLSSLMFPLTDKVKIPAIFWDDIRKEDFTWQKVSASQYLMMAAYLYYTYYTGDRLDLHYTSANLKNDYLNLVSNIRDIQLRDYFLTALMIKYIEKETDNYQQVLEDYKNLCKNKDVTESVAKIYEEYTGKQMQNTSFYLSDSALSVDVFDASGNKFSLSSLLGRQKAKLIVIDFWASWCGPCIMQIPALKELEKNFNAEIIFISISEDQYRDKWLEGLRKYHLSGNQFLLDFSNKSALVKALQIKTIPRFLLITDEGEVIHSVLPKPTETEHINKILANALARKKVTK